MKRLWPLLAAVFVPPVCAFTAYAGKISYVAVPPAQSDPNSGISRDHGYTTAVDGGNTRGTDQVLNGITLYSLRGGGQSAATADNCTLHASSGSLTDGGLTSKNIVADGIMRDVLSDMVFNNAGGDNSQIEIVLDPESLEEGSTYDLRVYICSSSSQNRRVNLVFFGDGQPGIETGFFNEDDARTSPGRFPTANQVYYINYRYTWNGDSTPGIIITQQFGAAPFCLYALTNQLVPDVEVAGSAGGTAGSNAPAGGTGATGSAGEGEVGEGLSADSVEQESDQIGVKSDDFYGSESLNSHGRWVKLARWGRCWQPTDVPNGWSPYTNGSWKSSDNYGWIFVSDEPWAWACYHYGRWAKVAIGCGWAWVPGRVWAPAWVSWRQGRDDSCSCIGWAPLPPEASCEIDVGISSWVDSASNIGPEYYTFINIRDFGSDSYLGCGCIYDRGRNATIIVDTLNCTNIYYGRNVNIYCGGPDFNWCNSRIRQLGGKESGKVYVSRYDNPEKLGGQFARRDGDHLAFVSPRIRGTKKPKFRPEIAESADEDEIEHGWEGIKDKKQERQVRSSIAQETRGKHPGNAPAKLPPTVADRFARQQAEAASRLGAKKQGDRQAERRRKRQAEAAGAKSSSLSTSENRFDQHPRKSRGETLGDKDRDASTSASGGGSSRGHPGQPIKRSQAAVKAPEGHAQEGAGLTNQNDTNVATDEGEAEHRSRRRRRKRQQQPQAELPLTQGPAQTQAPAQGGTGEARLPGNDRAARQQTIQQSTGSQPTKGGGQAQRQQKQQALPPKQLPQKGQGQQQQERGKGPGGGNRPRSSPTPPPRALQPI